MDQRRSSARSLLPPVAASPPRRAAPTPTPQPADDDVVLQWDEAALLQRARAWAAADGCPAAAAWFAGLSGGGLLDVLHPCPPDVRSGV